MNTAGELFFVVKEGRQCHSPSLAKKSVYIRRRRQFLREKEGSGRKIDGHPQGDV